MKWYKKVGLVLAIPFLLNPVVFVWYLNIGGIVAAIRQGRRERRAAREESLRAVAEQRAELTEAITEERPVERELVGTRH